MLDQNYPLFCKKPRNSDDGDTNTYYQVVVRVNDDIRRAIKMNNDKIYMDLIAHHVVDRFYINRCNKCQKFGHNEKDCKFETCCGYCCHSHLSSDCQEVQAEDYEDYHCVNCEKTLCVILLIGTNALPIWNYNKK